jgi:hypothetical protein
MPGNNGTRKGNALALAAGKFGRFAVFISLKAGDIKRLGQTGFDFVFAGFADLKAKDNVFGNAQMRNRA